MDGRNKTTSPQIEYVRHTKHELKRTDSFVTITLPSGDSSKYRPVKELGRGKYGKVTLFSNGTQKFVVKKPARKIRRYHSVTLCDNAIESAHREYNYTRLAYPDKRPYALTNYKAKNNSEPNIHYYEYRMLLPYIHGINLFDYIQNHPDQDSLIILFYTIAKELLRIHELGIIHGDISCTNIMVKTPEKIRFIDFAFAYTVNENATLASLESNKPTYFAPERLNTKLCVAHTNQDIYSLASTFYSICQQALGLHDRLKFFDKYPPLLHFITAGQSPNPEDRPTLNYFIKHLEPLLHTAKFKQELINMDEVTTDIFGNNGHYYSLDELFAILLEFCESEELEAANRLFELIDNSHMLENKKHYLILELFGLILEFIEKIPKIYRPNLLNQELNQFLFSTIVPGLQLLNIIIHSEIKIIPDELSEKLSTNRALSDIYERMRQTDLIAESQDTADKLNNLLLSCHIM